MKKFPLMILSLALLASLAGAAYLIAPGRMTERIGRVTNPAEIPVRAGKIGTRSPQDEKVLFHEWRIAAQPKDAEAYRLLAGSLVERAKVTGDPADFDRAWTQLDRSEALEPDSLRTLIVRAEVALARHRFPLARTLAERGLQKFQEDAELLGLAGDAAVEMGDFGGAEPYYRKRAEVAPDAPSTSIKLARLAELQLNFEDASALMQKALRKAEAKRAPAESTAWIRARIGEIEIKRGKLSEARVHLTTALREKPNHPLALEFIANLDEWEGDARAAEDHYRRLLSSQRNPKIQLRLSDLLARRGAKDEAKRLHDETRSLLERAVAGGHEGYLRELATLDLAEGRYQRAAELAAHDMVLRPTAESRALVAGIFKAAAAAGQQISKFDFTRTHVASQPPNAAQSTAKADSGRDK